MIEPLKGQYGSDCIVPDTTYLINVLTPKKYELYAESYIRLLKWQYESNTIVSWWEFDRNIEKIQYRLNRMFLSNFWLRTVWADL